MAVTFTPVEEDIIDSMAEAFDIPRIKAIEHFIENKRYVMNQARRRGDHAIADEIQKQLGE
jgi:hypothetical protein